MKRTIDGKIIVIKIGTRVLVSSINRIRRQIMQNIADDVAWLFEEGFCPVIVSSGAIACGNGLLGDSIEANQVAAMIGQPILMRHWREAFEQHGLIVGQGLLAHKDIALVANHDALCYALEHGVIPIINENDFVSTEEIEELGFGGDNDKLSAIIAGRLQAERLLILTDVPGLCTDNPKVNPHAMVIPCIPVITDETYLLAKRADSDRRTGMTCKIDAAKYATAMGVAVSVASGLVPAPILQAMKVPDSCTSFPPQSGK